MLVQIGFVILNIVTMAAPGQAYGEGCGLDKLPSNLTSGTFSPYCDRTTYYRNETFSSQREPLEKQGYLFRKANGDVEFSDGLRSLTIPSSEISSCTYKGERIEISFSRGGAKYASNYFFKHPDSDFTSSESVFCKGDL